MRQQFLTYVDLTDWGERYEVSWPELSLHNFIIGTPYIDIGEKMTITKQNTNVKVILDFHRRGWFAKEDEICRLDGHVFTVDDMTKKKPQLTKQLHVFGNWNRTIYWEPPVVKGDKDRPDPIHVWTKNPYPDQYTFMYGMSRFHLQMNYFPKRLHGVVPPTDTRRRPDQRALENGDMKAAAEHKDFLENKQRAIRKYKETNKLEHTPQYFEVWINPTDN